MINNNKFKIPESLIEDRFDCTDKKFLAVINRLNH